MIEGNRDQNTSDLLLAFLAISERTMEKTHVCDMCKVVSIDGEWAKVSPVNQKSVNTYAWLPTIDIRNHVSVNDYVLVIYTDYDTRANIKRIKNGDETLDVDIKSTKHDINNAIAIMKLDI